MKHTKIDINRLIRRQKKLLRRGRIRRLGIIEVLQLKHHGKADGRRGLPRERKRNSWDSPFMEAEAAAYEEFCDEVWGQLQIVLATDYAELETIVDHIARLKKDNDELWKREPKAPSEEALNKRLYGEESLSQDQVQRRRRKKSLSEKASHQSKARALGEQLKEAYDMLAKIFNHILEINNGTRMICERVKSHVNQRRNIYWDSAYRNHPEKERLPVYPEELSSGKAEAIYISQHKALSEEASQMLERRAELISRTEKQNKMDISTQKEVAE